MFLRTLASLPKLPACMQSCNGNLARHRLFSTSMGLSATINRDLNLKWSYVHCPGDRPLVNTTVGKLVDATAERYADREAVVSAHQGIRKTYQELKEDGDKLAAGFLALGLNKGDRVGIWGPNSYQWVLTMVAAAKAGLILVF